MGLEPEPDIRCEEALHPQPQPGREAGVAQERGVGGGVAGGPEQDGPEELDASRALLLLEADHQALDLDVESGVGEARAFELCVLARVVHLETPGLPDRYVDGSAPVEVALERELAIEVVREDRPAELIADEGRDLDRRGVVRPTLGQGVRRGERDRSDQEQDNARDSIHGIRR